MTTPSTESSINDINAGGQNLCWSRLRELGRAELYSSMLSEIKTRKMRRRKERRWLDKLHWNSLLDLARFRLNRLSSENRIQHVIKWKTIHRGNPYSHRASNHGDCESKCFWRTWQQQKQQGCGDSSAPARKKSSKNSHTGSHTWSSQSEDSEALLASMSVSAKRKGSRNIATVVFRSSGASREKERVRQWIESAYIAFSHPVRCAPVQQWADS